MSSITYPSSIPTATLRTDASTSTRPIEPARPSLLSSIMTTPYLPWATSAVLLASVPPCVKAPLGFPHLVQLPLFALIFGGSGYMIRTGDPYNGAGTTTGKFHHDRRPLSPEQPTWSLTYLFFHGRKALASRKPIPILLASTMATQALVAGGFYWSSDEDGEEERTGSGKFGVV
ncbi:BQ5605_C004g02683 [Microbotryum silenes-dioicae]|uniref:BQ5605_C004g02683 protein n=1 Tax=Microbotryum silenes-dioicae TaxID=796604 RepID=A0A2X0M8J4_9BASI|nr:BQ5605_C004g02683 [Microbotryum silenes-dioicae]